MSRTVASGQAINLDIKYYDANNHAINTDNTPQIEITDPSGTIVVALGSTNVASIGTGEYRYTYIVPAGSTAGDWEDMWIASIGGTQLEGTFEFAVVSGGTVEAIADSELGDAPDSISYSQDEIDNINYLLGILKKRLKSTGTRYVRDEYGAPVRDGYGEILTEECNVFSNDELISFLENSLSEFNQTPHFTNLYFSDADFAPRGRFIDIIVSGAFLLALAAQALIEKGREFQITDNGVSFQPPVVSDILTSELSTLYSSYLDRLRFQKNQFKPRPIGFGTAYSLSNYINPRVRALRHLRARQII